jgi:hypothetical protein
MIRTHTLDKGYRHLHRDRRCKEIRIQNEASKETSSKTQVDEDQIEKDETIPRGIKKDNKGEVNDR